MTRIYGDRDPSDIPAYTLPDVAHLTGVSARTLQSWVTGRSYLRKTGKAFSEPILLRPDRESSLLSFANATEAYVLSALRHEHHLSLQKIRKAVDVMEREFGMEHPLIFEGFKTDGVHLFIEHLGITYNVSRRNGQSVFEYISAHLKRINYDPRRLAYRFYPLTRRMDAVDPARIEEEPRIVMVDPRVSFGKPSLAGDGTPTASIASRFRAGDSIRELAGDLERTIDEIEEAIRYESLAA